MKRLFQSALLLVGLALSGCGRDNNNHVGTPIQPGQPIPPIARVEFYLLSPNLSNRGLGVFRVDSLNGTLTPVGGAPYAAGSSFNHVAFDAGIRTVYASEAVTGQISGFRLNPENGSLEPLAGFPVASVPRGGVELDLDGDELYVSGTDSIDGFRIDRNTGALSRLGGFPLRVPGLVDAQVSRFAPNGFFYVADVGSDQILTFAHDELTGALSLVSSIPSGGTDPRAVEFDPTGSFMYLAEGDGTLQGFRLGANGSLTRLTGFPVRYAPPGAFTFDFAFDQGNLYIGDVTSNTLNAFRVGPDGQLTQLGGYPATGGANSVLAYPTPTTFLYLSNRGANSITGFRADAAGTRTSVPGSPFLGSGAPTALVPAVVSF